MYLITRSDAEIDELLNRAAAAFDDTTDPAAETVGRTVNWLTGVTDEDPLS
jgi:hypothetical protein